MFTRFTRCSPGWTRNAIVNMPCTNGCCLQKPLASDSLNNMRAEDLLAQAFALPPHEQTRLAVFLLEGMNGTEDKADVEEAWAAEIARRLDDHESGDALPIPAETVFANARARIKRIHG